MTRTGIFAKLKCKYYVRKEINSSTVWVLEMGTQVLSVDECRYHEKCKVTNLYIREENYMNENKTGVWIRCMNGKEVKYNPRNGMAPFNVGDVVEVENSDVYAMFKIETVEFKGDLPITETYMIKPLAKVSKTTQPWQDTTFDDAEPIEMDVYRDGKVNIIVPYWYEKLRYRLQSIKSTEATIIIIRITRKETTNEDLEIKTCMISADEIKTDVLSISPPEPILCVSPSNQPEPITAMSEAEKNWWKECCGGSETERGLRTEIPTHIDWNGEMSATLTFSPEKIDEIMNKLAETKKEKDMYTKNLKDKIKKVIYVDKEMTVKEPMLDGNGKPVTKYKFYRGMVKVVWNCGTETVAYTSRFDRFNREEGFKTCVLKYLFGNAGAHDAVDFWTNKYVKYPSSCIEVTENLCKLEKILEKDKYRKDDQKGLPHAKFLRRTVDRLVPSFSDDKLHYAPEDEKLANEFKKLAKKYFPELKCREIYINDRKQEDVFVAIK